MSEDDDDGRCGCGDKDDDDMNGGGDSDDDDRCRGGDSDDDGGDDDRCDASGDLSSSPPLAWSSERDGRDSDDGDRCDGGGDSTDHVSDGGGPGDGGGDDGGGDSDGDDDRCNGTCGSGDSDDEDDDGDSRRGREFRELVTIGLPSLLCPVTARFERVKECRSLGLPLSGKEKMGDAKRKSNMKTDACMSRNQSGPAWLDQWRHGIYLYMCAGIRCPKTDKVFQVSGPSCHPDPVARGYAFVNERCIGCTSTALEFDGGN